MPVDFSVLMQPEAWIALGTLTLLEIILGIDNILFIAIISGKLPVHQQPKARVLGLALALIFRILLLMVVSWLVHFQEPLFEWMGTTYSGRDLILFAGGSFLLVKTISEIHHKTQKHGEEAKAPVKVRSFGGAVTMIILIDMVFSIDSILTAVGMVSELSIMIAAVVISMAVMLVFVNKISRIIEKHPSLQMLALSFLLLIAFVLILDGLHQHIERGYVYFALFFSLMVEFFNIRSGTRKVGSSTAQ